MLIKALILNGVPLVAYLMHEGVMMHTHLQVLTLYFHILRVPDSLHPLSANTVTISHIAIKEIPNNYTMNVLKN